MVNHNALSSDYFIQLARVLGQQLVQVQVHVVPFALTFPLLLVYVLRATLKDFPYKFRGLMDGHSSYDRVLWRHIYEYHYKIHPTMKQCTG